MESKKKWIWISAAIVAAVFGWIVYQRQGVPMIEQGSLREIIYVRDYRQAPIKPFFPFMPFPFPPQTSSPSINAKTSCKSVCWLCISGEGGGLKSLTEFL